ncbi:hypothetical protein PbJCM13498_40310 [Prolixibacter bellariivorans]|uniref:Lipoprotein n=1 Tax=Prolixibacter bellariivorans TaxID=314319 RepID=A0A5M4B5R7_9BACT|nr:hypothetical protein [Prolixibacter bellariivorans]GET35168.1 hypothetical protein PbJCM13498_40310 [Prolixibacter bellariivorans]
MKKIFIFLFVTMLIASCDPIEDRDSLPVLKSADEVAQEIDLKVESVTPGSNEIAVSVKDGSIVLWKADGLSSFETTDTLKLTSLGKKDIICDVVTDGGTVSIQREVEVTVLEGLVPEPLSYLVGSFGDGVTWVYATDYGDGTQHWYLSSPTNWEELWWSPVADGTNPADGGFEDELFFSRADDVNTLKITTSPGAEPKSSEFEFDADNMTITLKDMDLCDYDYVFVPDVRTYEIKLLNENELVLFQDCAGSAKNLGWVWRFKKKGYRY